MADKKPHPAKAATLLVELLTEELPPKALKVLGQEFALKIRDGLAASGLVDPGAAYQSFATPRRLAVEIPGVLDAAPDTRREVQGPSVSAPPQAVEGFAKKCGLPVAALNKLQTPKGEIYVAQVATTGQKLADILAGKIEAALKALPVPKVMRWGTGDAQFARPVHGLIMLHGASVIPGEVLGIASGNHTLGHRFLSEGRVVVENAGDYEETLKKSGKVIASFAARRDEIVIKINYLCGNSRMAVASDALYDEIAALVEAPTVYEGSFSADFLEVPEECLVLSMQQHQKYVPLRDKATGKLLPRFLFVSNIETKEPQEIIHGNERVLRARLSDAKFFYDQDRKTRLEARVERLKSVVYHNKLGSQFERVERIKTLAGKIAGELKADAKAAERAAFLCKADLSTDMVGEFPELQGVMGRYYALNDGESKDVADAIDAHYRPRFAGDGLPKDNVAIAVALADKLYTIVGMFTAGGAPTGDKDPYALRRQALGVLRILMETPIALDLFQLLRGAEEVFPSGLIKTNPNDVRDFFHDRLRNYLRERGEDTLQVEAVISQLNGLVFQAMARLTAVKEFTKLPEAKELAAANKRVLNIIYKNEEIRHRFVAPKRELMKEPLEIALMDAVERLAPVAKKHFEAGEYEDAMRLLSKIKPDVDRFFDKVMVMVDDAAIRNNRAALLQQLGLLMNQVADISKLAA
jgi:glycyl-tRNA synthetase beta chain